MPLSCTSSQFRQITRLPRTAQRVRESRDWLRLFRPALLAGLLLPVCGAAHSSSAVEPESTSEAVASPVVVEGDILVAASSNKTRSIGLAGASRLWPDGIVPYELDSSLTASGLEAVAKAVAYWNRVSGITLMSLDDWPAAQAAPADYVLFQLGEGCASWVGRRGGRQEVWVAPNCNAGSMMHEIGHLLGLEHEHTRPDRDQHIRIHWENIDPEKQHNFDAAPSDTQMLGDYDYGSIMHYGPMNFSANGEATITPLVETDDVMGQRVAPSIGDLAAVAQLYSTDLSIVTGFASVSGLGELSLHVSNDGVQGAHMIDVEVHFGAGNLLGFAGDGWQCQSEFAGVAKCTLARLAGGGVSRLLLELPGVVSATDINATVKAKTPDEDPANNADGVTAEPQQGAATALEDSIATDVNTTTTQLGAAAWLWFFLTGLLLHRLAGDRVNRQAGDRIE